MAQSNETIEKFEFVDVLRGLAVLMVIVVHHGQKYTAIGNAYYLIAFGQFGVQLFFVASAFTLCHSATSRGCEPNAYRNFLVRRFFRIAPLYYLAIPMYFVLYRYVKHQGYEIYTPLNIALNVTFLQSFREEAMNGIVPGGWSIGVEVLFYLIFPVLFALVSGWVDMRRWKVVCGLPLVFTAISLLVWVGIPVDREMMYYSLFNQLPAFLTGMVLYFAARDGWQPSPRRDSVGAAAFAMVALVLLLGSHFNWMPRVCLALMPMAAAACFVFVFNLARLHASARPAQIVAKIGQVSYSIYIFHFIFAWPITQRLVAMAGRGGVPGAGGWDVRGLLLYVPTLLLTIGASYAIGVVSKHLIEDRANVFGRRFIVWLDRRGRAVERLPA
ncbi:acyltransferase family protein [Novosphingobium huizhouense]|uniref:acyltransferase family protein n=1 Tax=Novosphingobium huizhouense TaxID=2866625 RepID=UPI001CD84431|nr:acyltransferase [Novosphingobium huizhouense]